MHPRTCCSGLRTSRRSHLKGAGALAGVAFTAACGAPQAAQQTVTLSTAPVTIQLYKRGTLVEADVATMLKDWNAAHPTWKVELVQNKGNLEALRLFEQGAHARAAIYLIATFTVCLAAGFGGIAIARALKG